MNNIERYPKCHMRTSLGNCDPIGGFCTSVKTNICEALHKSVGLGAGKWVEIENGEYLCSNCLRITIGYPPSYCPNCGSYNGGGEE